MPLPVDARLMEALQAKLGVSTRHVNRLISARANELLLPREKAAIALAAENGINVSKIASAEDLAEIRHAKGSPAAPAIQAEPAPASRSRRAGKKVVARPATPRKKTGKKVFVVHGRDEAKRKAMFAFLRAIGWTPIEWAHAMKATGQASPYIGEVLDAAFKEAVAVVVLLTPDDEARLRPDLLKRRDPEHERELTGQARPNVLFEAGMAFGHRPGQTVIVQIGDLRPFSDIVGRHAVHLDNSANARNELAEKLRTAGCLVDTSGADWLHEGDFEA